MNSTNFAHHIDTDAKNAVTVEIDGSVHVTTYIAVRLTAPTEADWEGHADSAAIAASAQQAKSLSRFYTETDPEDVYSEPVKREFWYDNFSAFCKEFGDDVKNACDAIFEEQM